MPEIETLSPKEAAMLAGVHSTAIYRAAEAGHVRVIRSAGRVRIFRESFEQWRSRLETRRNLRQRERELLREPDSRTGGAR